MFFRRDPRLFRPVDGGFSVELAPEARAWIVDLATQLDELLDRDTDDLRRLFPTAYPDDAEREAGYQILSRHQLTDSRREAIALMQATATNDELSEEELAAWMGIVNDLRLVLGTRLDVSEEEVEIDESHPDAAAHLLYHQLGYLVSEIVDALTTSLPPVEDDAG